MQDLTTRLAIAPLTILACLTILAQLGCVSRQPPVTATNRPTGNAPAQTGQPDYRQIENRIRDIVAKQLSLDPDGVEVNAPLTGQKVAADELDIVEIILTVEEAFGVEIKDEEVSGPDGELGGDLSVKKLAGIVSGKKNRK